MINTLFHGFLEKENEKKLGNPSGPESAAGMFSYWGCGFTTSDKAITFDNGVLRSLIISAIKRAFMSDIVGNPWQSIEKILRSRKIVSEYSFSRQIRDMG